MKKLKRGRLLSRKRSCGEGKIYVSLFFVLIRCTIIHEFSISVMKKSKFYTCVYLRKENEIVNRR